MNNKTIYALGFFDGVHRGHRALLRACRELADRCGCKAGAVTFSTHPEAVVQGSAPALLTTAEERERLLYQEFSMDTVLTLPFDRELRNMSWADFLRMLVDRNAAGFVCGDDFRFGHMGRGTPELLASYCRENSLPFAVIPEQLIDGRRVSSSYIRRQIASGDMETALRFLGHPYAIRGQVIPGHQLGRKLGFPTANLKLPPEQVSPKFGVYACRCRVEGKEFTAVTNVGVRPTVSGQGVTVEAWLLDFQGDLYGRELTVTFYRFLRPEMKFADLSALQAQIREDAAQTRQYFQTH